MKSTPTTPLSVWALTDGRAGNAAQAVGLAEALARLAPVEVARVDVPPRPAAASLPDVAIGALGRLSPRLLMALHENSDALAPPWPDLVIGAGRRAAPLVAHLRAAHGVKAVQILAPGLSFDRFDLVIVPEHDDVAGPRVVTSLGAPGRITAERIAAEAARWRDRLLHLPDRRLTVLLGGSGRMARWREEDVDRFCDSLRGLAESGWTLLVTASRRSDPVIIECLRRDLPEGRHLLHAAAPGTENPYPAILGLSEAVLVTEDSVNMASEAASSGLPVHVFRVSGPSDKALRFHSALQARSIARDFEGTIGTWSYAPLAEADRLAALLLDRLALHG